MDPRPAPAASRARRSCSRSPRWPPCSPPAWRSPTATASATSATSASSRSPRTTCSHATVGPHRPADRRRLDRAGPAVGAALAVRRARRRACSTRRALTSVALARSAGGGASVRSGADDARGRPQRFTIVFSRSRGKGSPTREAVQQSAGRAALQGAIRSRRDARHRDPARRRRLAAEHRRRRAGARGRLRRLRRVPRPPSRRRPSATRSPPTCQDGTRVARRPGRRARAASPTRCASACGSATACGPSRSSSPRRARASRSPRCWSAAC